MNGVEVPREIGVVVKPPAGGPWKDEILSPARLQIREMPDRRRAVGWVVAGIDAGFGLRKVPGAIAVELHQRFVALARHQHHRSGRHVETNPVTNPIDELVTPRVAFMLPVLTRRRPLPFLARPVIDTSGGDGRQTG